MSEPALKLTTYFGERDRAGGRFLADAFSEIYARHGLRTSLLIRATAGFGPKHRLRTDRQLTLSEDLPLVSLAVDATDRIEAALRDVSELRFQGLQTLERAALVGGPVRTGHGGAHKLTIYVGRKERVGARPAHLAVVDVLRDRGVAGATVLLGVDGTFHGTRERAGFFSRNASVPMMVIAVGDGPQIADAADALRRTLDRPLMTIERLQVCKRDGQRFERPAEIGDADAQGLGVWQKLMVYTGEQSRHDGRPVHDQVVRALRQAGAAGVTTLRGVWGYHGDHEPHGDSFWRLRRRVPVVTTIIDAPSRVRDWFAIVDDLTDEAGLVTSELVPALRVTGSEVQYGGLRLATTGPSR